MMKINEVHTQILREVLNTQLENKVGVKIPRFRIAYEQYRGEIQELLSNYFLEENNGHYQITINGILQINSETGFKTVDTLNNILEALKNFYRENPETSRNTRALSKYVKADNNTIDSHFLLLGNLGIFSSRDTEPHPYGMNFTLSEKILDQEKLALAPRKDSILAIAPNEKKENTEKPKERWKLGRAIGGGGQGQVFLAQDLHYPSQEKFAYKKLTNKKRIHRFKTEVAAILGLDHPNIIKIVAHELDANSPFVVYEHCEGSSLDKRDDFSFQEAWDIFFEVCNGLAEAHNNGIFHRDIKPANILLRRAEGEAVIADFGLCYVENRERHTEPDEAVGPRLFIAPELEDGKLEKITGACDVYSLGKLLYWLLSKGKMFSREKHREPDFDLCRIHDDERYEFVNLLLDKMLKDDPGERIPHAGLVLTPAKEALRLFEGRFRAFSPIESTRCTYCGIGHYEIAADGEKSLSSVRNFGISATGTDILKIFGCNKCGHVLMFRPDLAKNPKMWPK